MTFSIHNVNARFVTIKTNNMNRIMNKHFFLQPIIPRLYSKPLGSPMMVVLWPPFRSVLLSLGPAPILLSFGCLMTLLCTKLSLAFNLSPDASSYWTCFCDLFSEFVFLQPFRFTSGRGRVATTGGDSDVDDELISTDDVKWWKFLLVPIGVLFSRPCSLLKLFRLWSVFSSFGDSWIFDLLF